MMLSVYNALKHDAGFINVDNNAKRQRIHKPLNSQRYLHFPPTLDKRPRKPQLMLNSQRTRNPVQLRVAESRRVIKIFRELPMKASGERPAPRGVIKENYNGVVPPWCRGCHFAARTERSAGEIRRTRKSVEEGRVEGLSQFTRKTNWNFNRPPCLTALNAPATLPASTQASLRCDPSLTPLSSFFRHPFSFVLLRPLLLSECELNAFTRVTIMSRRSVPLSCLFLARCWAFLFSQRTHTPRRLHNVIICRCCLFADSIRTLVFHRYVR